MPPREVVVLDTAKARSGVRGGLASWSEGQFGKDFRGGFLRLVGNLRSDKLVDLLRLLEPVFVCHVFAEVEQPADGLEQRQQPVRRVGTDLEDVVQGVAGGV